MLKWQSFFNREVCLKCLYVLCGISNNNKNISPAVSSEPKKLFYGNISTNRSSVLMFDSNWLSQYGQ